MNGKTISISLIMPRDRHKEVAEAAAKTGMSLAAFLRQAAYTAVEKLK